jgi:DNA polymerase V
VRTVQELRGIPCHPLELSPAARKSITVSRSFGNTVESLPELQAAVAFYVSRAGEKLRREKLVASALTVFIETDRFRSEPQYAKSLTLEIAPLSNLTPELRELAFKGLAAIYQPEYAYRRAGVLLADLVPESEVPRRLWEDARNEQMRKAMQAMDEINQKLGRDTVKVGYYARTGAWQTRFRKRSPRYTTNWNELMKVR